MAALIWSMLIFQCVLATTMYIWIVRKRKLISLHNGMNISMVAGGGLAFGTGILLIYEFPIYYMEVTGVATLIGIVAGALFGKLFSKQAMLSGYVSGLMTGMMSPMVGAAALYSIPFLFMIEIFIICSLLIVLMETFRFQKIDGRNEK